MVVLPHLEAVVETAEPVVVLVVMIIFMVVRLELVGLVMEVVRQKDGVKWYKNE